MIIERKETTVAYRCPECGGAVLSLVGLFSLAADMMRLKCPCGGSSMTINLSKDDKVRLTVPCFVCRQDHMYTINKSLFFKNNLFVIDCAYSGVNLCFIGKEDDVSRAVAESEKELLDLLHEAGADSLDIFKGQDDSVLPDAQIHDIILFVLRELESEGHIKCKCSEAHNGEYDLEVGDDYIKVYCKNCGAKKFFPLESVSAANDFLNSDYLELE